MPFYEYVCEACGKDFVLLQSVNTNAKDTVCPYCSEKKAKKNVSIFSSGGSACNIGGHSWGHG